MTSFGFKPNGFYLFCSFGGSYRLISNCRYEVEMRSQLFMVCIQECFVDWSNTTGNSHRVRCIHRAPQNVRHTFVCVLDVLTHVIRRSHQSLLSTESQNRKIAIFASRFKCWFDRQWHLWMVKHLNRSVRTDPWHIGHGTRNHYHWWSHQNTPKFGKYSEQEINKQWAFLRERESERNVARRVSRKKCEKFRTKNKKNCVENQ